MIEKVTSRSVHEQPIPENEQVAIALQARTIGPLLRELFEHELEESQGHECRILDAKYEPGNYCTILYQLGDRMLIGTLRWGKAEGELPATARLIAPLGMQVYRFEHDPALPGLATALDGP